MTTEIIKLRGKRLIRLGSGLGFFIGNVYFKDGILRKDAQYDIIICTSEDEKPGNADARILTGKAGLFRHYGIVNGIEI